MNNLRVDVILESEQRSASPVNIKFVAKLVGFTLLALIAIGVSYFIWSCVSDASTLERDKIEATRLGQEAARVQAEQNKFDEYKAISNELAGIRESRIPWREHLAHFQAMVPSNIQIESFAAKSTVVELSGRGKPPSRVFTLSLTGRAEGDKVANIVESFVQELRRGSGFGSLVESVPDKDVVVKVDPEDKRIRTFSIKIIYKPRSL